MAENTNNGSNKKKTSYLSARESRKITRFNRRVTKRLEKQRADANKDEQLYTTKMKDEGNVVEFDNVCTYFFTDAGTVKAVDGVTFKKQVHFQKGLKHFMKIPTKSKRIQRQISV